MPSFSSIQKSAFSARFLGADELDALFKKLPDQIQRRAIREGLKKGSSELKKHTKKEISKRVKKRSGNLSKSLYVANVSIPSRGIVAFKVAFGRTGGRKGFHAHLVEFGHRVVPRGPDKLSGRGHINRPARKRRRKNQQTVGLRRGTVKGRGFFRAAVGKYRLPMQREMIKRFHTVLDREIKKANAKAKRAA